MGRGAALQGGGKKRPPAACGRRRRPFCCRPECVGRSDGAEVGARDSASRRPFRWRRGARAVTCAVREELPDLPCAMDESCRRGRLHRASKPAKTGAGDGGALARPEPAAGARTGRQCLPAGRAPRKSGCAAVPVDRPPSKQRMTDQQARGGMAPWPDNPARHPGTSHPRSRSGASGVTPIGPASMIPFHKVTFAIQSNGIEPMGVTIDVSARCSLPRARLGADRPHLPGQPASGPGDRSGRRQRHAGRGGRDLAGGKAGHGPAHRTLSPPAEPMPRALALP